MKTYTLIGDDEALRFLRKQFRCPELKATLADGIEDANTFGEGECEIHESDLAKVAAEVAEMAEGFSIRWESPSDVAAASAMANAISMAARKVKK